MAEVRVTVPSGTAELGSAVQFKFPDGVLYIGSVVELVDLGPRLGLRIDVPKLDQELADLHIQDDWISTLLLQEYALQQAD